jgi:chemotaxis protein methyltransferase CheR
MRELGDPHGDPTARRADVEADTLLLRARLVGRRGEVDEAEAACADFVGLQPGSANAEYALALCREQAGDPDAAMKHAEAAIRLDGTFALPHVHLGLTAGRAGDVPTARRELARALVLLPDEEPERVLLFGGGLSREALVRLCITKLTTLGANE